MMDRDEYFLSMDLDTGEIEVTKVQTPMESVPFGCYIPHTTGTKEQMEQKKMQLINARMRDVRKVKKVKK